ncbi:MAG: hypothetical protein WD768_20620 [Phycisphaeraceae bacterium]
MNESETQAARQFVALKTLAQQLDADPSSVRRWLRASEIQPVVLSDGPRPAIRFKVDEINAWLSARESIAPAKHQPVRTE